MKKVIRLETGGQKMTIEEFEKRYFERSAITIDEYHNDLI